MKLPPWVQRQIAQQRTSAQFPYLIKVSPYGEPPLLYANSSSNITYGGEVYNRAAFSIQPPARDGAKIGNATLTISAVDQAWPEKIRSTRKPATLRFIAVIVFDEGAVSGIEPLEENSFTLRMANWNETAITWEMVFDENMAVLCPVDKCNAQTTPGIA